MRGQWVLQSGEGSYTWKPCRRGRYDVYVGPASASGDRPFVVELMSDSPGWSLEIQDLASQSLGAVGRFWRDVWAEPETAWRFTAGALANPSGEDSWAVCVMFREDEGK